MLEEIRREFGENVASIVLACSDTTLEPKPPWRERKEAYIEHLPHEPDSVLLVSLADKLFNARGILREAGRSATSCGHDSEQAETINSGITER
jgi:GTP pyrophosphokinase